jgi:glutamate N-acetyltransferase/amino-acid N-acetyltransferase
VKNIGTVMAKNITQISPFAPKEVQVPFEIQGVKSSSTCCGLYKHKEDLTLFSFVRGTSVAGVFTKSLMASPPVIKCRENLKTGRASALIVNSGNSLAMTGKKGEEIVETIVSCVANELNVPKNEIFICSTGVIGALLDSTKITNAVPKLAKELSHSNIGNSAKAIMTTDTFPKIISVNTKIDGNEVAITGIAKGSGMIEPNMATMLAYIFTDAAITSSALQELLNEHIDSTFNSITVDSDTSTSDSLIAFATNQVGEIIDDCKSPKLGEFSKALHGVMKNLAKQIVMDGEGAQKFVTIVVEGAESGVSAKVIAKSIANSPLVKTAIAGCDPNWGRIAMAIGKTSEKVNLKKLKIAIGTHTIYENEELSPMYSEEAVYYYLRGAFVEITVNVGAGSEASTVWTCDLTHGYIDINVDYRS